MLSRLFLKDFAIAAEVDFDLGAGLGVVSGETGAGKSLLVDALLLLCGQRADPGVVRHGAERAELGAEFSLADHSPALAWLRDNELDDDSACQLRRVIRADGGSRAWINGRPATAGQLANLTALLVEIHGQHEHQALLDRNQQTALLDTFAGNDAALAEVRRAHERVRDCRKQLDALQQPADPADRIAFLQHQIKQFARLNLAPDHIDQLLASQRRLAAGQEIADALQGAQSRLAGPIAEGIQATLAGLRRVQQHAPVLAEAVSLLDSAGIQLDEAAASLSRMADGLELDAASAEAVDAELGDLHDLARRHRVPLSDLHATHGRLQAELDDLEHADVRRQQRQQALDVAIAQWRATAAVLSQSRLEAARRLEDQVGALMNELGMSGGRLQVLLEALPADQPTPLGAEKVELCVSANAGQPPRPLRKVASGGELARISLAIEVATFGGDGIPCMVFDEVDSGIGGAIAEVVGHKLRALSAHRQVLCVTHLAQVAAQGHYHYRVSKATDDGRTSSRIERLETAGRVEELARMLGGVEITSATRTLARQMLQR